MKLRSCVLGLLLSAALLAADPAVDQARKKVAEKKYDEAIALLESANKAKASPEVTKALASTWMAKADAAMYDPALPPRMKYPTALRAYREVLKYDKEKSKAKKNIATIEDIYKQMGRPIPQ